MLDIEKSNSPIENMVLISGITTRRKNKVGLLITGFLCQKRLILRTLLNIGQVIPPLSIKGCFSLYESWKNTFIHSVGDGKEFNSSSNSLLWRLSALDDRVPYFFIAYNQGFLFHSLVSRLCTGFRLVPIYIFGVLSGFSAGDFL